MNDWQKILDLLRLPKTKEYAKFGNPLIEKAAKYMYKILQCLTADIKKGKLSITDEKMKKLIVYLCNIMVPKTNLEPKLKLLEMTMTDYRMSIILEMKDLFQNEAIRDYISNPSFYNRHKIVRYDLKMLQHIVCKKMLQQMGNDILIWVGMDVDADAMDDTQEPSFDELFQAQGRKSIKLEIISTDILNYDRYVFDIIQDDSGAVRELIKETYRPYLIEYYINTKELGKKQYDFLQQMYNEKGWYKAKLTDITTNKDMEQFITFPGVFVYSASPIEYKLKKLVILDTRVDTNIINEINTTYDMKDVHYSSNIDIQRDLEKLFRGIHFQKTRIYKVGNGNCIYNMGKKGNRTKCFFYDIGFDMHVHIAVDPKRTEKNYQAALKKIRNSKPHCVILSHWDEDHFRGCVYARDHFFDIRWIAPDIKKSEHKANAKRLFLYLYKIGSLMVIQRGNANEIIIQHAAKSQMKLYMGKRKKGSDKKITNCNCQGIAILMENDTVRYGKIRCLMQGDVPYMSLPPQANFESENPYEYLVAPHHGAEMDCSLLCKSKQRRGQAVICCTGERKENRPQKNHLNNLKKCYKKVTFTAQANRFIQFNLLKKKDIKIF